MDKTTIGRREWVRLPELGLGPIEAKVDSGAFTSSLHAVAIEIVETESGPVAEFEVWPDHPDGTTRIQCRAPIVEERPVKDSGGEPENRPVIRTPIRIGDHVVDAEVTLTDRSSMKYQMLLGRTAIRRDFLIDVARKHLVGKREASGALLQGGKRL